MLADGRIIVLREDRPVYRPDMADCDGAHGRLTGTWRVRYDAGAPLLEVRVGDGAMERYRLAERDGRIYVDGRLMPTHRF